MHTSKITPQRCGATHRGRRCGSILVETIVAVSLFTIVLLASMAMVESGRRFSSSTMQITTIEDLAQQMLFRMEHELASAAGHSPIFSLPGAVGAGDVAGMTVSSTLGFPPRGRLLLDRGTALEERVAYSGIGSTTLFTGLSRGQECTDANSHTGNDGVDQLWSGLAQPLDDQDAPAASEYDGIALESGRQVYFRGDGTGFSYRIPIDPSGGDNPLNGNDLFWGAETSAAGPSVNGWMAMVFVPKEVYDESEMKDDINEDGDTLDVFDIGQLRRWTWDTTNPNDFEDLGLGPSSVIQERCNAGGDLDGDGFDDPLFLWNEETNLLHVRLFLLGTSNQNMPIVRKVESVMFLRNEPEL